MAATQSGNRDAFELLARDCLPYLRRFTKYCGVPRQAIDDVSQDVLLAIYEAREKFDASRGFRPWLNVIARNSAIDYLRRRRHIIEREVSHPYVYDAYLDSGPTPEQNWENRSRIEEMQFAIKSLPIAPREAVACLVIRELSLKEASAETGKSVGSLKVNLHRALKALSKRASSPSISASTVNNHSPTVVVALRQ